MTCEDIIPSTTLGVGAGATVTVVTGGFDWVAVLILGIGPAFIQVQSDSGAMVVVANIATVAAQFVFSFGGSGGTTQALPAASGNLGGVPFVPNQIVINLSALIGNTWTYAVIGGYNE